MPRASRSFVGRYFHSFHPQSAHPDASEPLVRWQGEVLSRCEGGYQVGLFSWVDGDMNTTKIVPAHEMASWQFYPTNDAMLDWYDAYSRRVEAASCAGQSVEHRDGRKGRGDAAGSGVERAVGAS